MNFFFIDSGAEISIVKPAPSEKRSKARTELISVNGPLYKRMVIALWICVWWCFKVSLNFCDS